MDSLDINSEYGKYHAIIKDIVTNKKGFLIIDEIENEDKLFEEAFKIFLSRKAQKVFIKDISKDFELAYKIAFFELPYTRFPQIKQIKIKELTLDNRHDFLKITNDELSINDDYISYNETDILEMIRNNKKAFLLSIEKKFVGTFIVDESKLILFAVKKELHNNGLDELCLKKIINKLDCSLNLTVSTNNSWAINLYQKVGFIYKRTTETWYKKIL